MILTSTRRMALRRVLEPRGAGGKKPVLLDAELVRRWVATGLRQSDLQLALRDLRNCGWLRVRAEHGAQRYELTDRARRAGHPLLQAPLEAALDWVRLRMVRARERQHTPAGGFRRRRVTDRLGGPAQF